MNLRRRERVISAREQHVWWALPREAWGSNPGGPTHASMGESQGRLTCWTTA